MENEFVSYEQAVALKELGFDEECLAYFKNKELYQEAGVCYVNSEDFIDILVWDEVLPSKYCTAPLKQQVFRWCRENYNIYGEVFVNDNGTFFHIISRLVPQGRVSSPVQGLFTTYEEAENACIDKLIELVKQIKS